MTQALAAKTQTEAQAIEQVLVGGDLKQLTPEQRLSYYQQVCNSLGLNPLTKPFEYITLNGKLTLYARKDCTDQLRSIKGVSIEKPDIQQIDDLITVTVSAVTADGRMDSDIGVVHKKDMGGNVANALMKAVTKAKRRVTLSICGLGMLDETEVETIPNAQPFTEQEQPKQIQGEPADHAQARRNMFVDTIWGLLKRLNEAGDDIQWTKKALKEYINHTYEVEDGLDSLSFESFEDLIQDLEKRLHLLTAAPAEETEQELLPAT